MLVSDTMMALVWRSWRCNAHLPLSIHGLAHLRHWYRLLWSKKQWLVRSEIASFRIDLVFDIDDVASWRVVVVCATEASQWSYRVLTVWLGAFWPFLASFLLICGVPFAIFRLYDQGTRFVPDWSSSGHPLAVKRVDMFELTVMQVHGGLGRWFLCFLFLCAHCHGRHISSFSSFSDRYNM